MNSRIQETNTDGEISGYIKEVFKKYPELRKQLWAGELWNDGYFVRSAGDEVTADILRKYIEYQTHEDETSPLKMFQ